MLGPESGTGDWELRLSMRSFWTNYLAAAQPWIIGTVPEWIDENKVRCLHWPDPYDTCKDANLLHKAIRLAWEPAISDPFILCSDDHILLRPSLPADFQLWHRGEIPKDPPEGANRWEQRLVNTGHKLRNLGYPAKDFDAHVPYPIRKRWVKQALQFDFATPPGMCVFSTILNCSKQPGIPLRSQRVRGWLGSPEMAPSAIDAKLARNQFACLNPDSLANSHIVSRLEQLFPEPAAWELDAERWRRRRRNRPIPFSAACLFGNIGLRSF